MSNSIKLDKTYGVVHCQNHSQFFGFIKKVGSSNSQIVDIYINDKLIDSIKANKFIQKIEDMYDIERYAFTYILSKEQHIEYKDSISFKTQDSKEELLNSPYTFNLTLKEYKLLCSLDKPLKEEPKNTYSINTIGFLANKENLESPFFVEYIQKIMHDFQCFTFKAFYINKEDKDLIEKHFNKNSLEIIELVQFDAILNSVAIYLSNNIEGYIDTQISNYFMSFKGDILVLTLNTHLQNLSVREFNNKYKFSVNMLFNTLDKLGLKATSKEKTNFHQFFYNEAKKKLNINLDFSIDEPLYSACVYWPLFCYKQNKEFSKFLRDFQFAVQEERKKLIK